MAFVAQNAITENLFDQIYAILNGQGVQVYKYQEFSENNIDYNGEAVVVVRTEVRDSALQAGQQPAGFYYADISLSIQSYDAEDPDREILGAMEKVVRDSFERTMFQSYMAGFLTTMAYITWLVGGSTQENEGRINKLTIDYTWLIRPSQEV